MTRRAATLFNDVFGDPTGAVVARAPGRVNLIGEHPASVDGFVLATTIDRHSEVIVRQRADRRVRLYAADLDERFEFDFDRPIDYKAARWLPSILGPIHELVDSGRIEFGVDAVFRETIPADVGLGRTVARGIATAIALDAIFNLWLNPIDMAIFCREAHDRFAGGEGKAANHLVARLTRPAYALLVDGRSLDARHVPMSLGDSRIVIVDSGVRFDIDDPRLAERLTECNQALAILSREDTSLTSMRDLTPELLAQHQRLLPPDLLARCSHIMSENQRALEACERLASGDLGAFGRLLSASHLSLRNDFEVSHSALDWLVEATREIDGVLGARLTGTGFGGCTVNLVLEQALPEFEKRLQPMIDDWSAQSIVVGTAGKAAVVEVIA
jgi:galactokinase